MKFKSIHPTIRIRLFLLFLSTLTTMTVLPYIIIYFSGKVGNVLTGILFLLVMLANILGSIVGGYVSDRIGRRKIILVSEIAISIGFIGAAFSNSSLGTFPYFTFAFFLLIQFSNGAVSPVYQALIIDLSTPEERKLIYTYSYWIRNIAVAIGSLIGAFFFFHYLFLLLLSVATASLASFVLTLLFIQETYIVKQDYEPKKHNGKHVLHSYQAILTNRFFVVFSISSLFVVSIEEQLTNYIGVRLKNEIIEPIPFFLMNIDGVNLLGILKGENTILVVFLTLVITQILRKWNERIVLLSGLLLYFVGYIAISILTNPYILISAMFIATLGEIMHSPVMQTMLANLVPDNARSTYMAVYSIATILGVSSAGIFLIISNWLPPLIVTTLFSIMGLVSLWLFYRLTKPVGLNQAVVEKVN